MTLEYITLSLDPGVAWELMIEQGDPFIAGESSEAYCYYIKDTGCVPYGKYSFVSGEGTNSCDDDAEVKEVTYDELCNIENNLKNI